MTSVFFNCNCEKETNDIILSMEIEKEQKILDERRKLEEKRGVLWVTLDVLANEKINGDFDDFLTYIKIQITNVLPDYYRDLYEYFFSSFLSLWDIIYKFIKKDEYELYLDDRLISTSAFSVGIDELFYDYNMFGKQREFLIYVTAFSTLLPDTDKYYFLQAHFALIANFLGIDFSVSFIKEIPIYTFMTNTRLSRLRNEYLVIFDDEVINGIRKSPMVDKKELRDYIKRELSLHNEFFKF